MSDPVVLGVVVVDGLIVLLGIYGMVRDRRRRKCSVHPAPDHVGEAGE